MSWFVKICQKCLLHDTCFSKSARLKVLFWLIKSDVHSCPLLWLKIWTFVNIHTWLLITWKICFALIQCYMPVKTVWFMLMMVWSCHRKTEVHIVSRFIFLCSFLKLVGHVFIVLMVLPECWYMMICFFF